LSDRGADPFAGREREVVIALKRGVTEMSLQLAGQFVGERD
jgi:hypothetical protein